MRTAMVVDDSVSMRQMVAETLRSGGFTVTEGSNGQEALRHLDGRKFDLIITDLNMPLMDGVTFIKEARQRVAYRFTPILMLTTESQDVRKQEGKRAGATGWLVKPFNPVALLGVIDKVVPR